MAELKIFIAGSKELKTERNGIKIIANDLSSLYSSRGIHITANSYEPVIRILVLVEMFI